MRNQILFITLFLLYSTTFFSQDLLIKKDSSRLEVKLLEVNPLSLKFKLYSNLNGPDYIIDKKEVALIIYQNGIQEVINVPENLTTVNANIPKGSKKRDVKLKDYVNFNLQAGVVINNAYCNKPQSYFSQSSTTSSEKFSGYTKKNNINLNIGFNFLLGKSPYVKHIIGVNYLRSQGEFDYEYHSGGYTSFSRKLHYKSTVDFINIVTGIRFTIAEKFHIEPCISLNSTINSNIKVTGTEIKTTYSNYQSTIPPIVETTDYSNAKAAEEKIGATVSYCPRISYEFQIKNQKLGIYYSYNIAYEYRLPWNMIGITYYPFKKLRS
jgi:hypothetical protein